MHEQSERQNRLRLVSMGASFGASSAEQHFCYSAGRKGLQQGKGLQSVLYHA